MTTWSQWTPNNRILTPEDAEAYYDEHAAHGAVGDYTYFECDSCGIRFMVEFFDEPTSKNGLSMARKLFD